MSKMKKLLLATSIMLGVSAPVAAVDLEYKGFYQRLNLIEENKLDKITMAFYLVDSYKRSRCVLSDAKMLNKNGQHDDIAIADDGQLLVPLSQSYYDNFAVLRVEQQDAGQNCILQMQMQVKDKQQKAFSFSELALITWQMQELVDEFGGLLSFMMPNVQGLHIDMKKADSLKYIDSSLRDALNCDGSVCKLLIDMDDKRDENAIEFSTPPVVVAPWVEE
ncbi:DUF2987 domain-containing protein [Thalassotalea sp. HSM 43]|nr:DUF2987 domain-containing protein [Thalassotalea sp. HSM 43]